LIAERQPEQPMVVRDKGIWNRILEASDD
jgi:hypothetical protein